VKNLNLDGVLAQVNAAGEGLWDLHVEVKPNADRLFADVWLVDYNEFVTCYNMHDTFIHNKVFKPLEKAVIGQSGDDGFYFDAFDHAGRFVGAVDCR